MFPAITFCLVIYLRGSFARLMWNDPVNMIRRTFLTIGTAVNRSNCLIPEAAPEAIPDQLPDPHPSGTPASLTPDARACSPPGKRHSALL